MVGAQSTDDIVAPLSIGDHHLGVALPGVVPLCSVHLPSARIGCVSLLLAELHLQPRAPYPMPVRSAACLLAGLGPQLVNQPVRKARQRSCGWSWLLR